MPTRLVLVDDHPALIHGLASLFDSPEFQIAGTADTAAGFVDQVRLHMPDIAVTDLSMPGDSIGSIGEVVGFGTRVVVFTAYANPKLAFQALEAGALGFVLKGRPAGDLFDAVRAAQADEVFVSPELAPRILSALHARGSDDTRDREQLLSRRERQIVDGLLRAKSNKEIARELNLSEKTIKHYMTNLMAKLGARNRVGVVLSLQSEAPGVRSRR